jgi:hypothetical protein
VAGAERVIRALRPAQKAARTVGALDAPELPAAAGERLVPVGLVTHVPDQAVARRVEDIVERDRQLDGAQAGGEVPPRRGADLDQLLAQLRRDVRDLAPGKTTQVLGTIDL